MNEIPRGFSAIEAVSALMSWKRAAQGGVMGVVGFLLSPLSWWNDLFVNVPIAVAAGWLVSLAWPGAFKATVLVAYWLTNVLGFVLLHKGVQRLAQPGEKKAYTWPDLRRDLLVSLAYTALLVALMKAGVVHELNPL